MKGPPSDSNVLVHGLAEDGPPAVLGAEVGDEPVDVAVDNIPGAEADGGRRQAADGQAVLRAGEAVGQAVLGFVPVPAGDDPDEMVVVLEVRFLEEIGHLARPRHLLAGVDAEPVVAARAGQGRVGQVLGIGPVVEHDIVREGVVAEGAQHVDAQPEPGDDLGDGVGDVGEGQPAVGDDRPQRRDRDDHRPGPDAERRIEFVPGVKLVDLERARLGRHRGRQRAEVCPSP